MAWLRELGRQCQKECGRAAVVELLTNRNASIGVFCRPCGTRALKQRQAHEEQEYQRQQELG